MTRQLHPGARDAALTKVVRWTAGAVALSVAGTLGLGTAIAASAPPPKQAQPDYTDPAEPPQADGQPDGSGVPEDTDEPGVSIAPPDDRPESSSGDEDTTTGGS